MAHKSIKIFLDDTVPDPVLAKRLETVLGVVPDGTRHRETDWFYNIFTNRQNDVCLKVREYEANATDITFERALVEENYRQSAVCVTTPRGASADADIREILGSPDHVIPKTRQIFKCAGDSRLRVYVDTFHAAQGDRRFLEIQLQSSQDARSDKNELSDIIERLGLSSMRVTTASYAMIAVGDLLSDDPRLIDVLGKIPEDMLKELRSFPVYKADRSARLIERGAQANEAYLITKGCAHVVDDDIKLYPGNLLGEFALLERDIRTSTVDVEEGTEAIVLPRGFTARLLRMPAFAVKYMQWKVDKAQRSHTSAFVPG